MNIEIEVMKRELRSIKGAAQNILNVNSESSRDSESTRRAWSKTEAQNIIETAERIETELGK